VRRDRKREEVQTLDEAVHEEKEQRELEEQFTINNG
jgi:hypothetical protein